MVEPEQLFSRPWQLALHWDRDHFRGPVWGPALGFLQNPDGKNLCGRCPESFDRGILCGSTDSSTMRNFYPVKLDALLPGRYLRFFALDYEQLDTIRLLILFGPYPVAANEMVSLEVTISVHEDMPRAWETFQTIIVTMARIYSLANNEITLSAYPPHRRALSARDWHCNIKYEYRSVTQAEHTRTLT